MPEIIGLTLTRCQGKYQRQTDKAIGQTYRMGKEELRQVVAANIRTAIKRSVRVNSANDLANKAGISQSNLSEALRGLSSLTTDTLCIVAELLDCQPWELLTDSDATRQAALEKMLGGPVKPVPNERVEKFFPPVKKESASKRRKR